MRKVTYWLYDGKEVIASIIAPEDSTQQQVIALALESHDRIPLCFPDAPFSWRQRLARARVVYYGLPKTA